MKKTNKPKVKKSKGVTLTSANNPFDLLTSACYLGEKSVVDHLLKNGLISLDSDLPSGNHVLNVGGTALSSAMLGDKPEIVKYLISKKANCNHLSPKKTPLLSSCILHDKLDILEILLKSDGINLNLADDDGFTALHTAIFLNDKSYSIKCVHLLIEAGVDVNHRNKSGGTPLIAAVVNNNIECIKLLLDANADPKIAMCELNTPFYIAVTHGYTEPARFLLENGVADANEIFVVDGEEFPAIFVATEHEQTEIVRLLLEFKADPNAPNNEFPVLFSAIFKGQVDIVKLLINAKVDVNIITFEHDGPLETLDIAKMIHPEKLNQLDEIEKLLIEAGAER